MKTKFKQITDQDLGVLTDDLISDIIPLKIDAGMSVSTLHALQTIFYLRLQLAQVSWAENEPVYESLCRNRFEQIASALTEKYDTADMLSEKITILNRLENISQILYSRPSDFVIEQRRKLIAYTELTFTERYRLDNLLEFNYDNVTEDIDRLLAEARTAFDIAILFDIDSLGTEEQYDAVTDLYMDMLDNAIAEGNTREIANLLAVAADSNNDPVRRALLADRLILLGRSVVNGVTLPERRVNEIAAEVYTRIDALTGKYAPIPA